jgi:hypothetical protein
MRFYEIPIEQISDTISPYKYIRLNYIKMIEIGKNLIAGFENIS